MYYNYSILKTPKCTMKLVKNLTTEILGHTHIYFCFRETKLPVLPHTSGPLSDPEGGNFRQQALY